MTLPTGARLGPYEILAPLGAGGMGEVYRARDPRLSREVAVKVLPSSFSSDADRVRRFEQEARAAGVLNHPNVTAVYDIGREDESLYVVSELLEGETLRSRLGGGALAPRRATDYALQIAHGLAAAHEKGIVHRDLKPENVFVTKNGRVKILDFGLAKLTQPEAGGPGQTNLPTVAGTEPGVVLGTLGYMSPEQVRGYPTDSRSDIFSFGAILYEMLSGRRAFAGDTAADTMTAILMKDPPELTETNRVIAPGLDRIVRHCLEKNPEERFHSAHDLAFDLTALSGDSIAAPAVPMMSAAPRKAAARFLLPAVLLAAGLMLGFFAREALRKSEPPSFARLTFRRGTVWNARFTPDGQTVVYSAAWEANPVEVFLTRPESPESRPLGLSKASLFAVSSAGELAVMLRARTLAQGYQRFGTLARVPLAGGSPREVALDVRFADWSPDGKDLAVARAFGMQGRSSIEFPIGKVIYESPNRIVHPRVSPDGRSVAFFETKGRAAGWSITVVDVSGKKKTLTEGWKDWWNLAWSPDGKEIWFAAPEAAAASGTSSLHAVTLGGRYRLVARMPGTLELHDISREGRVLLARVDYRAIVMVRAAGEPKERDLSWLDGSRAADLSPDGKTLLITESGEGGGPNQSVYLRNTDGSAATRIGEGEGYALSPDAKWVLSESGARPPKLVLLPAGPGTPAPLEIRGFAGFYWGSWFPDGKRLLVGGNEAGKGPRLYALDLPQGRPRPISSEGLEVNRFGNAISPDGRFVAATDSSRRLVLCSTEGGEPRPVPGVEPGDLALRWSEDGRSLYTHRAGELPARIWRLDLATGRKELVRELAPDDPAGVTSIETILLTPDGGSYAYSYAQNLSDLYVFEGLGMR